MIEGHEWDREESEKVVSKSRLAPLYINAPLTQFNF